ncbi:DUF2971 domain-containing protein [Butyricicoccus intestinisimiae]|uniref:DUF2971 domain-containing protein n=1 Tax=Butyricicoccus intestinisimiae TaxID=2841509 RepID=A0ABS6ENV1_9FIRM|nr:DUF2971 domain-containing protein [Butyricicoccus intestinisimiae]MBU5489267.1 DUF2971 domain-containing protein [Butyricicoccus intestinisimiae]
MDSTDNTVYHYTSPSGLLGIVDNGEDSKNAKLWFTRWDSLNDKNERYDIQEVLKEYKELKGDDIREEFQDAIQELIDTEVDEWELSAEPVTIDANERIVSEMDSKNVYICSFSTDGDSLPMWNYYSKSSRYEGYALGIDFVKWENIENPYGYMLNKYQIIYQEEDKRKKLDEILLKCEQSLEIFKKRRDPEDVKPEDIERVKRDLSLSIAELQFCFKDEHFSHEKEVRVILRIPKDKDISNGLPTKYWTGNGYIIPYVEASVPKEAITSVTVGPLLEKELAEKNVKEMMESRGYSCKVHTSEVPIRF